MNNKNQSTRDKSTQSFIVIKAESSSHKACRFAVGATLVALLLFGSQPVPKSAAVQFATTNQLIVACLGTAGGLHRVEEKKEWSSEFGNQKFKTLKERLLAAESSPGGMCSMSILESLFQR